MLSVFKKLIIMNKEIKSKVCTKCGEEKELEEFYKDKTGKYGRNASCKACQKAQRKQYYRTNKQRAAVYQKAYYKDNKQRAAAYQKAYQQANKEEIAAKQKAWYEANKDKELARKKAWYEANKDKALARKKAWYEENKDKELAWRKEYNKKRYSEDPAFRTMISLRSQTRRLGDYKSKSTIEIVGISPQEFWERNGSPSVEELEDLHIDHIVPLSWFDLSNEDHVAVSSHHSNLQYLNSEDNLAKGSSYAGTPDNVIAYKDNLDIEAYVTEMIALINIL